MTPRGMGWTLHTDLRTWMEEGKGISESWAAGLYLSRSRDLAHRAPNRLATQFYQEMRAVDALLQYIGRFDLGISTNET